MIGPSASWYTTRAAARLFAAACLPLIAACGGAGRESAADAKADAFRPLAVGDTVPAYAALTLTGDTARVGGGDRGPVLVNVWATWCTACREEMADLEALHREFGPRGLIVLGVSVDEGDGVRVRRFVDRERLTFVVAHDPAGRVQQLYGTVGVPETYLVGADGRLLWRRAGNIHGALDEARTLIARAVGTSVAAGAPARRGS